MPSSDSAEPSLNDLPTAGAEPSPGVGQSVQAGGQADAPAAGQEGAPGASAPAAAVNMPPAAVAERLKALFPALFTGPAKPLKLRIQVDIQQRAPGVFSRQALSAFFRRHTGSTSYLIAVSKAPNRIDLDGQPAGEVSAEHRQAALDELARRRAHSDARREQEEQGRRRRASLLRNFKNTTLTRANFCALNGLAEDALDAVLAQAEQEAKEDAARPAPGRHHPRGARPHDGPGGRSAPRSEERQRQRHAHPRRDPKTKPGPSA